MLHVCHLFLGITMKNNKTISFTNGSDVGNETRLIFNLNEEITCRGANERISKNPQQREKLMYTTPF
jgi:hypothetical protein